MSQAQPIRIRVRRMVSYWPHAGLGVGLWLNGLGIVVGSSLLIGTASNLLVVCGLFLGQRHRNDRKEG